MLKIQTICAIFLATVAFGIGAPAHSKGNEDGRRACENERNQGQRNKCLRQLEAAHPKASHVTNGRSAKGCQDCAKVLGVRVEKRRGESNAIGTVAGGAAGALLGNQIGSGSGKTIATIAGAVGGAYAGRKIQEKVNETRHWVVDVQYDNGRRRAFEFQHDPGLQRGDRVRGSGDALTRY